MNYFQYGSAEIDGLKLRDPRLGDAMDQIGMIKRAVIPDMFTALISSIVHQQISNKAAATVWGRIASRFEPLTSQRLISIPVEEIQKCGMSMRKAGTIHGISQAVASGELELDLLTGLTDDEVVEKLSSLPGVGIWTAEMLMIFSMQRPDVVSWHDLAIRRGMMNLYRLDDLSRKQFEDYRERYRPFGSVASLYLWQISKETAVHSP